MNWMYIGAAFVFTCQVMGLFFLGHYLAKTWMEIGEERDEPPVDQTDGSELETWESSMASIAEQVKRGDACV